MASQMQGTSGIIRKRPGFVDNINAQRQFLPQMIANKANARALQDQAAFNERNIGLQERGLGIQEQTNALSANANAEAARANTNTANYNNSQLALQQRGIDLNKSNASKAAGLEMLKLGTNLSMSNPSSKLSGSLGDGTLGKVGGMLGSAGVGALSGYGAAKMFGGKSKTKNMLFGAGAGLLSGFLGGNWGNWGSMASSGAGGLLGGMFG